MKEMKKFREWTADEPENAARLMDQERAQGVREIPGGSQVNLSCRPDHRRGRGQGRRCKTHARPWLGVFEIAVPFRGNAFRVVHAAQLAEEIWVVHAFQKKSTQGVKTPLREIDLIKDRLKRLKEMLR
jgi:hypothetical protein